MKVSVVIVTWNSALDIEGCLDAIRPRQTFEIVVVDNGSTDGTAARVRSQPRVRLMANAGNTGYARANNQGIRATSGEYVLLLNPDACVQPGAIDLLTDCLDRSPDVGAAVPRLVYPDGRTQQSIRSFPTASTVLWELSGLARLFPHSRCFGRWRMRWFDYGQPAEVEQPMASCLLVRRSIIEELAGFDETFPIFFNDVDLSYRMFRAGYRTVYIPDARVVHRHGASTARVKAKMIYESHRSMFRYLRKHDRSGWFWLKSIVLIPLLEISALMRVVAYRLRSGSQAAPQASGPARAG